jgi:hypothetical protein
MDGRSACRKAATYADKHPCIELDSNPGAQCSSKNLSTVTLEDKNVSIPMDPNAEEPSLISDILNLINNGNMHRYGQSD